MLKSISCNKILNTPLKFKKGLNAVVGADDAHNSIGKSSILMLIDYVFGGGDFLEKCSDVIKNVGHLELLVEFEFDKVYSFRLNTNDSNIIYFIDQDVDLSLIEYCEFLRKMYGLDQYGLSFRECVSPFFRVSQRNNYNLDKPLNAVSAESWLMVRKRILKLFNSYNIIENLENDLKLKDNDKKAVEGTFKSGAVFKINKATYNKNESKLHILEKLSQNIEESMREGVADIQKILNDRNIELMNTKNDLVEQQFRLKKFISRSNQSLGYLPSKLQKDYSDLIEIFPAINMDRLLEIDSFHHGIVKIMKEKLKEENAVFVNELERVEIELENINRQLNQIDGNNKLKNLLKEFTEIVREKDKILKENEFYNKLEHIKSNISNIKKEIDNILVSAYERINCIVNNGLAKFISEIYLDHPIVPKFALSSKNYEFDAGDDNGTGKNYGNLIALDLTFLEETCLPCMIHDSLLLKNMANDSIQNVIKLYSSFEKQIFISIDEIKKYQLEIQEVIKDAMFLKLDAQHLAFKISWNKKS